MIKLLQGDCRDVLRTLPDESVHCVVTSPPYFGLRDYGTATWEGGEAGCDHLLPPNGVRDKGRDRSASNGKFHDSPIANQIRQQFSKECGHCGATRIDSQIGLEPTPDAYVAEMVAVFREVRRVLRTDGVIFLNLGDSYWANGPRQTGRNDTDRETPGGRGGSFRGGVRRAIVCDTPGKAPANFLANGCLCQSLCGACRKAYRIGKSHNDGLLASTRPASNSVSSLAHTGSPSCHLPTLGSIRPVARNSAAIPDLALTAAPEPAPLPVVLESTIQQSAAPSRDGYSLASNPDAGCQLCGRSLIDCELGSFDKTDCNCGTGALSDASDRGTSGKFSSDSAYLGYTTAPLKPKNLVGIPWRVAFALQADGWYLRQDIIWSKPNPMPESVRDRCTKAHEYLFLLAKSERYFYDADAIKEPASWQRENNPDWQQQRAATNERKGCGNRNAKSGGVTEWSPDQGRNKRSVWEVATQSFPEAHFATFPPALIEPCIKAGCPKGGTVLDPFGGAGTTGLVADRLQRNAILIELNSEYAAMAERRIKGDAGLFYNPDENRQVNGTEETTR